MVSKGLVIFGILLLAAVIVYGDKIGNAASGVSAFFGLPNFGNLGNVANTLADQQTAKQLEPTPTAGQEICDLKIQAAPSIDGGITGVYAHMKDSDVTYYWVNCRNSGTATTASLLSFLQPNLARPLSITLNAATYHFYLVLADNTGHQYSYVNHPELIKTVYIPAGNVNLPIQNTLTYVILGIPHVAYTASFSSDLALNDQPSGAVFTKSIFFNQGSPNPPQPSCFLTYFFC